tara:strand:- start:743 stop:1366 length:624 start_codon:yes stop_codon:yes gene_type:complete
MKKIIYSFLTPLLVVICLTSCEKIEFEQDFNIYENGQTGPSFYDTWRLTSTQHTYIDINEVGADSDTTWTIYDQETYIAMQTNLSFDLVEPGVTQWEITNQDVIVNDEDPYIINGYVYPSPSTNPYDQCWDINGNGYQDTFEDTNGDGICDLFDCGPEGLSIAVYNTVRVFNIIKLNENELHLEFEGQYFEDFDYYTTVLKFERVYN